MRWRFAACEAAACALVLTGCVSREAAPTTTAPVTVASIAAPTTVSETTAPSTTVPPTTASPTTTPTTVPPTTVPPTTVPPPTPAEAAQAEITATLAAIDADMEACWAAPDVCDVDAVLNRFFAPDDNVVRRLYRQVWERLNERNRVKISTNRFERTIVFVTADADGITGTSYHCEVDNSFSIPKDTPPDASTTVSPDAQTGYTRYFYEWQRQPDGTWRTTRSELGTGYSTAVEFGELPSLTESEVAACF